MPKIDPDVKQLNADLPSEQVTREHKPRQTDRHTQAHTPTMNEQGITRSHTLKGTQIHTIHTEEVILRNTQADRQTDSLRPTELQPHTQDHIGMWAVTHREAGAVTNQVTTTQAE